MDNSDKDIESLYEEMEKLSASIDVEVILAEIAEQSIVELKNNHMMPIFDEYYGGCVFENIMQKGAKKKLRDPKGGLTAAGRAYFKRKEGANLKPGVRGAANTPEKMRRKGSFLTRFFTNPSGPMKDEKGRATRLALSAAAWGEPIPQDMEDARKLAAKGRRLLERYKNTQEKKSDIAAAVLNKSMHIDGDLHSIKSLDLVGLVSPSFTSMADTFEPDNLEVYSRSVAVKNLLCLTPSHTKGEAWMVSDEEETNRMARAAKFMQDRRKRAAKKSKRAATK